ncbi:MAG TPA: sortase [Levilinea sp.]|nr:sortase [Levilinea sp.]
MAPSALMVRTAPLLAMLALAAGCATALPAPMGVAQSELPPPVVHVDRLPTLATDQDAPAAPLEQPVRFSENPADLARALHGDRLVDWIRIDAIQVYAPVTPAGWSSGSGEGLEQIEWDSPGAKVGWVLDSSLPGDEHGNIILYGHNNINASVFRDLAELRPGDAIRLSTEQGEWAYEVAEVNILPVSASQDDRAAYAQYLLPGLAPRLTLISCWPPDNNTHRVIVSAYPRLVGGLHFNNNPLW